MYAVIRETQYSPDQPIHETPEFQEFQKAHAERNGYRGSVVAEVGEGRYLTFTLWETSVDMNAARHALEPVVRVLLDPLMTSPSKLLGTGPVVANDLDQVPEDAG